MEIFSGEVANPGLTEGSAFLIKNFTLLNTKTTNNTFEEYLNAKKEVEEQLTALYKKVKAINGKSEAGLLLDQLKLLSDQQFDRDVENELKTGQTNLVQAIKEVGSHFEEHYLSLESQYFQSRAIDIRDVVNRLINTLQGNYLDFGKMPPDSVIIADHITPSETLSIDFGKLKGIVLVHGAQNSHITVLAQSLKIPLLLNVDKKVLNIENDIPVVVDGEIGELIVNPDENYLATLTRKFKAIWFENENLEKFRNQKAKLEVNNRLGIPEREIHLFATVSSVEETETAFNADAEGIGMFRSEFIYLRSENPFDAKEQYQIYLSASNIISQDKIYRPLIIRTLDIGDSKNTSFMSSPNTNEKTLGFASLQKFQDRRSLFQAQLEAIFRCAELYQKSNQSFISLSVPYIKSQWELDQTKELIAETREKLSINENLQVKTGIIIDTPASAIMIEDFLPSIDFVQVNSAALAHRILGVTGKHGKSITNYFDSKHPALLQVFSEIGAKCYKYGKKLMLFGELAEDFALLEFFLKNHYTSFSINPSKILQLRKLITDFNTTSASS